MSSLLTFRKPKDTDNGFSGQRQQAGRFTACCGPRYPYQAKPSGAVCLGSHVKGAIMHGGVGSECSVHPLQGSFISECQLHAHPLGSFTQRHRK